MNEDILLIIPDKADAERDVLAQKWSEQYGDVMKIGKFWVKPETNVLDLGYNSQIGWFVVEFNSSWGAGLNFCAPEKVLACIKAATINP